MYWGYFARRSSGYTCDIESSLKSTFVRDTSSTGFLCYFCWRKSNVFGLSDFKRFFFFCIVYLSSHGEDSVGRRKSRSILKAFPSQRGNLSLFNFHQLVVVRVVFNRRNSDVRTTIFEIILSPIPSV